MTHATEPATQDSELRYDAVLFDVGGTLIGFVDAEPFRQFLEAAGLPAGEEEGRRLYGRFLEVIRAERDRAQGVGATEGGLEEFWRSVFAMVWPTEPYLADAMYGAFRANRFDRLLDDVRPTLDQLSRAGLRLAVISNFTGGLDALLIQLGVRDHFEFVITSAQVGLAKPDPRIFDLATRRLDLPRWRLLYVGDHYGDDILGARAAGLDSVLVDQGFRGSAPACPRIGRLRDLVRYVRVPSGPARALLFDFDGVVRPRPIPGTLQLLHDVHGRGYRIGLVTGAARADARGVLELLGVLNLFEVIVSSEDTARGKPYPEPYLAAAAALDLPASACLVIENAPRGIQSARAAGMSCVALETTLPSEQLGDAERTFRDATALSDWLLSF